MTNVAESIGIAAMFASFMVLFGTFMSIYPDEEGIIRIGKEKNIELILLIALLPVVLYAFHSHIIKISR